MMQSSKAYIGKYSMSRHIGSVYSIEFKNKLTNELDLFKILISCLKYNIL